MSLTGYYITTSEISKKIFRDAHALAMFAFVAMILSACQQTPLPLPTPTLLPIASLTALPSATPTSTPAPSATSPKPSPTPFITAPAPPEAALVPILMYHHIRDLSANVTSPDDLEFTVAPNNFQAQMEWLAQNGYHAIAMPQLNAHLKDRASLPTKPVVISFDDGWVDGYTVAFPILKKNNLIGTYFVYLQPLDKSPLFLSWNQIGEMSTAGMDFEAHTLTHPNLKKLAFDNATREIVDSKKMLEDRLKKPVVTFAYPYGEFNNAVIEMVKRAGYESAVSIDPGYRQHADRIYLLQRIHTSYRDGLREFIGKLPP